MILWTKVFGICDPKLSAFVEVSGVALANKEALEIAVLHFIYWYLAKSSEQLTMSMFHFIFVTTVTGRLTEERLIWTLSNRVLEPGFSWSKIDIVTYYITIAVRKSTLLITPLNTLALYELKCIMRLFTHVSQTWICTLKSIGYGTETWQVIRAYPVAI